MRNVSRRFRDSIGRVVQWQTVVQWSNDGWVTWDEAGLSEEGSVTAASTSQIRWTMSLTLVDVPVGRYGINPFTTQIRIRHGMAGEPLMGMGVYRVTSVIRSLVDEHLVEVSGSSFEAYVIAARYTRPWVIPADEAKNQLQTIIKGALPDADFVWRGIDHGRRLPKVTIERDRWPLVDGGRNSPSISRSLGARTYVDGDGTWIIAPVPTLADPPTWEAEAGEGGVLIGATEDLTNEGVYNVIVANGISTDGERPPVGPGVAMDTDPLSLTYALKTPNEGGFGICPRFHASQFLTTIGQCQVAAEGMLAPYLGLKQQVTFDSLHDPSKEPGDVGIVRTADGLQRVILDSVTYDLLGGPLQCQTRTTTTRLDGANVEAPDEEDTEEAA